MTRKYANIPSKNHPDVSVHITWSEETDPTKAKSKPTCMRAYAISTDGGTRKDYSKERKRRAKTTEEIPSTRQYLYNAVCEDIDKHERKAPVKLVESEGKTPFELAFAQLESSPDPVCSEWSPEYSRNRMTYFQRNILPILNNKGSDEWGDEATDELRQTLVENILKTEKSAGHEATAIETANKSLRASDTIYQRMCDYDSSLPKISLRPQYNGRHSINEKIKSLPRAVRRQFTKKVENLIDENPRLAMAIICMYDAGLRTAEAAAVWADVVVINDTAAYILVRYQVKKKKRCPMLKTRNAWRLVPTSTWGKAMLERCLSKLPKDPNDPNDEANWACDTRELSSTVRTMLLESGLSAEYFAATEAAMREKPDYDGFGRPIYDVSAYILRRDWSSRARNICGFTSLEIDYCLGHYIKKSKQKRDDLRLKDHQKRLSTKLERYVHNPRYSKHPGCAPYPIEHSSELKLIPFDIIRIINNSSEVVNIKLDIEAIVNGESISIITPENSQTRSTTRFIPTHCIRTNEPVIGKSYVKEDGTLEDDT